MQKNLPCCILLIALMTETLNLFIQNKMRIVRIKNNPLELKVCILFYLMEEGCHKKVEYDRIINTFHSFADNTGICQRLVRK